MDVAEEHPDPVSFVVFEVSESIQLPIPRLNASGQSIVAWA